jgi:hypothetical protein
VAIASSRGLGDPVDVTGGLIALQGGSSGAAVVDRTGRPVLRLSLPELRPRPFTPFEPRLALTGARLCALVGGRLDVYDLRSGSRVTSWPLSARPDELAGAAAGLVVFVHGRSVHVLRLRDGREAIVRVAPAQAVPEEGPTARPDVHADISRAGLFYAYNRARGSHRGRVVFVPLARVLTLVR